MSVWKGTASDITSLTTTINGIANDTDALIIDTEDLQSKIGIPTDTDVSTDIANIQTDTTAIVADTNELQTDWTNGGRLDLLLDAVKAKTDNLPSDPADASDIAAAFGVTNGKVDVVDGIVDAIKVKTDLIGALTDDETIDSILGRLYIIDKHMHSQQNVYPTLANGVTVTGGAGAWQLGSFVEVIPASTITNPFDIHWVNFGVASANDTYELVLYSGALSSEVEIGRCRTTRISNQSGSAPVKMQTIILPANTRISAKVATSSGGADTIVCSVFYHIY